MKIYNDNDDSIDRIRKQWQAELPDLDTQPMQIIGRILRAEFLANAKIRRLLQFYNIDLGGFDVLATLRRGGAPYRLTPTALYKALLLTSGAMTNRLDVLERAGLVKRLPDPNDRRGTLIELTVRGKELIDKAIVAHMAGEASIISHLTADEQRLLARLLKKILIVMEDENEIT